MTRCMARAPSRGRTATSTRGTGRMTRSMARAPSRLRTARWMSSSSTWTRPSVGGRAGWRPPHRMAPQGWQQVRDLPRRGRADRRAPGAARAAVGDSSLAFPVSSDTLLLLSQILPVSTTTPPLPFCRCSPFLALSSERGSFFLSFFLLLEALSSTRLGVWVHVNESQDTAAP